MNNTTPEANEQEQAAPVNQIENGKIAALHLNNGLTIVGRIDDQTEDGFVIYMPCELMVGMNQQRQMDFAFVPWLAVGGLFPPLKQATVPYDLITMPRGAVPAPIEARWLEMTSGIAVAPKQGIILTN